MIKMEKTFVMIPTYNEKENIERLIKEILNLKIKNLEIVVVDDNSPDGTWRIVEKIAKKIVIGIPCFNEEDNVVEIYKQAKEAGVALGMYGTSSEHLLMQLEIREGYDREEALAIMHKKMSKKYDIDFTLLDIIIITSGK